MRWKDIDNTVDGLCRISCMQSCEDKMSGLRKSEGRSNRFKVAHLTDEDHIWILSKHMFQCPAKGERVMSYFPLVDNRLFMKMEVFDRVLNCDDMTPSVSVHFINNGCKCCRLSTPGRASNKDKAFREN